MTQGPAGTPQTPHCAACGADLATGASFCPACGAAVFTQPVRLSAFSPLDAADDPARPPGWWRRTGWMSLALAAIAVLGLGGVAIATRPEPMPDVSPQALRAALERGDAQSRDPLCMANGLAYDAQPVHVQAGDAATLSWMDTLAAAGLYEREPDEPAGESEPPALRTYAPRPELTDWTGGRQLCIARGLRLASVRGIGAVGPTRVRGQVYPGVAAEVVWSLDGAAPWLASPEVADAFARQLPAWRGGRWQVSPQGWRLMQQRRFFLYRDEWMTAERLERVAGLPPR